VLAHRRRRERPQEHEVVVLDLERKEGESQRDGRLADAEPGIG
jgi:hypothetical protein